VKLSKLVEEIRKQKEVLEALRNKHKAKQEAIDKRRVAIEDM
jgi:SMC interacting uncharacterized protein involved in chromosome segregation